MKKSTILPAAALLLLASCGNNIYKQAESAYVNYEYASAARMYETILKTDQDNTSMLHLADCYRHMNRHADADSWYSRVITTTDATDQDKLNYAAVLQEEGKYQQAADLLLDYLRNNPDDVAAQNRLAACEAPAFYSKSTPFYTAAKVSFTSESGIACFSPFISGNKMYFTSAAPLSGDEMPDNITGNGFLDIYAADLSTMSAQPIPGDVNSDLHEATPVIAPAGDVMYFTRSRVVDKKAGQAKNNDNHLELCMASLVDGSWKNVTSLPFNSTEYSCGHPALSADGNKLFFISDMPGGKGGTDLYYSDFKDGQWGTPVNLMKINTNGDEMFPTLNGDEFCFSSDGYSGAGGLDIFKCRMENGLPAGVPERMIAPFNSSADDFGLVFDKDQLSGYFSSNRESQNGDDAIYSITRRDPKFFVKTTVKDKVSGDLLKNMNIEVKNATTGKDFTLVTDEQGSVIFPSDSLNTYNFCFRDPQYFACYAGGTTGGFKGTFSDTTYITITPEKIVINKPIRLENIYYDYNKWNIRPDAAIELDKLVKVMQDNPQIKIELSSHTDCRGSDNYNMKLSQKRAQAAVDYIVSKGISADRITAKGYGESVPLNRCTNGVKCSEDEWQFNRRTEFKVTKIVE